MSLWWTLLLWLACIVEVTHQRHLYTAIDFPSETAVLQRFFRARRSDDEEEDDEGVDKPRPLRFG